MKLYLSKMMEMEEVGTVIVAVNVDDFLVI
jgi:hypothetical protein